MPAQKRSYCGRLIPDTTKAVYLDESGVDGMFCDDFCASAFIQDAVTIVAQEDNRDQKEVQ